jgi:dCMP deaminase
MQQCDLIASRATCDRKQIGAIIVKNKRIISSGYNGSLPGLQHCDDIGHDMENSHCIRTVHAEVNSIANSARQGVSIEGAIMYCNTMPCWNCFKTIVSAGIVEIVYRDEYRADRKDKVIEAAQLIPGFIMRRFEKV